ncbi:hypothetical protein BGLA2_1610034 [Burkholderia gladioli]|nr:hypothetical protein BGLA2_1610034 [Burkholderia gladioli]
MMYSTIARRRGGLRGEAGSVRSLPGRRSWRRCSACRETASRAPANLPGADARLKALRHRYAGNPKVTAALAHYEDDVE